MWSDGGVRTCHIVLYPQHFEVKICEHGQCVASVELPSVAAAFDIAEAHRPGDLDDTPRA
jgi:hypothetical protein